MKKNATKIRDILAASGVNGTKRYRDLEPFDEQVIQIISVHAIDGDGANADTGFSSSIPVRLH